MSRKNAQKEIEEAQKKARGEMPEERSEKKKQAPAKIEEALEKKNEEKTGQPERIESELAEEEAGEKQLEEELRKPRREAGLEELAAGAQPVPAELHDSPYVEQLSHKPMAEIYKEIKDIYRAAEDKGYLSTLEQKQVLYLNSAVERKIQDEEHGTYSFSEEAARAASLTQQLSATLLGSYQGKKQSDLYKDQERWNI